MPGERNANNEGIIFSSLLARFILCVPATGNEVIMHYSLQALDVGERYAIIAKVYTVHISAYE